MSGAIAKAYELAAELTNVYISGQFENMANPIAHAKTTGPEIIEDTDGEVDIFIAAVGTGGTLTGTAAYLKKVKEDIKVIAVEPEASPLLSRGVSGAHKIQGIGANFVPKTLNKAFIDEIVTVSDDEAYEMTRLLPKTDGILIGVSSGAVLAAAKKIAEREDNKGKNIVVFLPDSGERYLSTEGLF